MPFKYKEGDRVVMKKKHFAEGDRYQEAPKGALGTIRDLNPGGCADPEEHLTYSVEWDHGTKNQTLGLARDSALEYSWVDERSLKDAIKPVSEEELAEVYKLLGVQQ